jgi:hypothetical protein
MDTLRRFNGDEATKSELLEYLIAHFQKKIIERAIQKEDVESLADAIIEVKKAFEQLEVDYGIKPKQTEATNDAR